MKVLRYSAVAWKEAGSYVSKCPELRVSGCGDSFEDAVSNLRDAVELYLENARLLNIRKCNVKMRDVWPYVPQGRHVTSNQ